MLTELSLIGLDDNIAGVGNMIDILDIAKEENNISDKVYKELKQRLRVHRDILELIRTDNAHK